MGAQHTPGPWTRNRSDDIYDANGDIVCGASGPTADEQEANGRVIAAAPDMLAALKALFENPAFELGAPKVDGRIGAAKRKMAFSAWNELVESAQAAIAKAEGRS